MPGGFDVLATDYDGTLAERGTVATGTLEALRRWRDAGGRIVLVTGRRRAVAVADALAAVKTAAHEITTAPNGAGVAELVERLLRVRAPGR